MAEPRARADFIPRARGLIERAIRRRWKQGLIERDPDGAFTALIGAEAVEKLMREPAEAEPFVPLEDHAYDPATPLGALGARLALAPTESDALAVALACEIDPTASRLVSYLGGNQSQFAMTIDMLFEIAYRPRDPREDVTAALLLADLAPHRRLRRLRFFIVDGADSRPTLAQCVRLHPRVTAWLVGQDGLDAELTAHADLVLPAPPRGKCDRDQVALAAEALRGPGRLLFVDGPPRSGRELLVRFAAAELGRPLLVVSGRGLGADRVVAAFREADLRAALLAFTEAGEVIDGDPGARLRECLDVFGDSVALVGAGPGAAGVRRLRPSNVIDVTVPPFGERLRLWEQFLGADRALDGDAVAHVAGLYNLGVSGIIAASDVARERAAFARRQVTAEDVPRAVRDLFDADLTSVATRVEVSQTWEDLVLPDELGEAIVGLLDRVRLRNQVLGDWGFARKIGKGLGLTALFSGEPGTGKSMVAGLIARELGLDLYVIDLARVVSKWLGETEKNLARAFDAAEVGHVMLLFDEADFILGKRSADLRSSNERNSNLETNFVLARLEQFNGIALFTTNLSSAIDPAIMRRMSAHLKFPFPDVTMRAELWRRMLPAEAPTDGAIDFAALGARYEMSGGFIRNVVLRAAFAACRAGQGIDMDTLTQAARDEYNDRGSLLVGGRLA